MCHRLWRSLRLHHTSTALPFLVTPPSMPRLSKAARTALAYADMMRYLEDGPPDAPSFDAEADAAAAVAALVKGGLVLTTYDVLQQEVHFSGSSGERLASLRHKKRYRIPQSPLLQVHSQRCNVILISLSIGSIDPALSLLSLVRPNWCPHTKRYLFAPVIILSYST
jgi:hypothetical protein